MGLPTAAAAAPPKPSADSDAIRLIRAAKALGPLIRANRHAIEDGRRVPMAVVKKMAAGGLFRMLTPRAVGGLEVDLRVAIRAIEEVSRADGSAGWAVMIGNSGLLGAWLRPEVGMEIFGRDEQVVTGSVLNPKGKAWQVEGGYRCSGRWQFSSGVEHCEWMAGSCIVFDGEKPRKTPEGGPEIRVMYFRASDIKLHDTWRVMGLKGSGSHDFEVEDVFVPTERTLSLNDPPYQDGVLYRLPLRSLLANLLVSVPLGIARGAIETLSEMAGAKTPQNSNSLLRDKATTQVQLAQAEAVLRSARALVFETVGKAWNDAVAGRPCTMETRALLRISATHAAFSCAQVVNQMYTLGGGSAIYNDNPLERAFRDAHVATQHMLVAPATWEAAGRVLLGLDPGVPVF